MSISNTLETTVAGEAAATVQKIAILAVRILQRNTGTQHLNVEDTAIYADLKRQVLNTSPTSTLPAGHIGRGGS